MLITSHGKPVAKLVSVSERRRTSPEAIADIIAFQRELEAKYDPDPDFDWKAARDDGRP